MGIKKAAKLNVNPYEMEDDDTQKAAELEKGPTEQKGLNGQALENLLKKAGFKHMNLKKNFERLNNKNLTMEWFRGAEDKDFEELELKSGSISRLTKYFKENPDPTDEM